MIVALLAAGLGNQMFRYAAARQLSERHKTKLILNGSWFKNIPVGETVRHYELDQLNIQAEYTEKPIDGKIYEPGFKWPVLYGPDMYSTYFNPSFGFNEEVLSLPNNVIINGDFQNERYFTDVKENLLKEFTPSYKLSRIVSKNLSLIEKTKNSVSVHVRRTDYIDHNTYSKTHGPKGTNYYKLAVEKLEKLVGGQLSIFVFSDDQAWCKNNLKFKYPTRFVEDAERSFDDIWLMSHCDHNVIANSSYSWWGAWLNKNPKKIVVAPQTWFLDGSINSSSIVPESWIKI